MNHAGAVLSSTIDKYCYITARKLPPFFPHKSRIVWSQIELVTDPQEIKHPSARACVQKLGLDALEVHYDGDLPGQSGLGSSSAFTVCMLHALHALKGEMVSKTRLAEEAIDIEHNVLKENVGCQDQVAAAFGGMNVIDFTRQGFIANRLILTDSLIEDFQAHMTLFFIGLARNASEVAGVQIARTEANKTDLNDMQRMVCDGAAALCAGRWSEFGDLLNQSWRKKRRLSPLISNRVVDEAYGKALRRLANQICYAP
jgi:D-glycero-alpha-D-manno-heptose-7-phosphate kinase